MALALKHKLLEARSRPQGESDLNDAVVRCRMNNVSTAIPLRVARTATGAALREAGGRTLRAAG